jgi:hypothetical protein
LNDGKKTRRWKDKGTTRERQRKDKGKTKERQRMGVQLRIEKEWPDLVSHTATTMPGMHTPQKDLTKYHELPPGVPPATTARVTCTYMVDHRRLIDPERINPW